MTKEGRMTLIEALTAITLQAGGLPPAQISLTPAERRPAEVTSRTRNVRFGQLIRRAIKEALVWTRGVRVRRVVWLKAENRRIDTL